MLQTNIIPHEAQAEIVKKLEELNKWQEEQQKCLQERQTKQRQLLLAERQNLLATKDMPLQNLDSLETEATTIYKSDDDDNDEQDISIEHDNEEETCATTTQRTTSGYCTTDEPRPPLALKQQPVKVQQKPKRTFLKRGEGLKQRFKIDPDELRLNNLPRYKFANSHPSLANLSVSKSKTKIKPQPHKRTVNDKTDASSTLDPQEKRFQQLLISSRNVCNSTPDIKATFSSSLSGSTTAATPKVRFAELTTENTPNSTDSETKLLPPISWAKVLDSQQIKPLAVQNLREHTATQQHQYDYDENLSIFELLEQQANNGTIDMNSSCIKRLMARKLRDPSMNDSADDIPIDNCLKESCLNPLFREVDNLHDTDDTMSSSSAGNEGDTIKNSKLDYSVESSPQQEIPKVNRGQNVRVRFSEKNDTHEYCEDTVSESSTVAGNELSNIDLFEQFKEALFSALNSKAENAKNHDTEDSTIDPPNTLSDDLQEKANLIKSRLSELETEIATFKESNLQLTKAKQDHELEKTHFAQERLEALEQLNDEKIQMEIYLHDERMKIEDEKRKFEQQMRMQKTSTSSKERKEITRLKQELEALQLQLKQKDQTHVAAQARLRAQLRNTEKDQKQLYEDIENLTKENKRLQNENLKIARENNNKMLQEINKNIAKLAPKLAPVTYIDENTVRQSKHFSTPVAVGRTMTKKHKKLNAQKSPQTNAKVTFARCKSRSKQEIADISSSESEEPESANKTTANEDDYDEDNVDLRKELETHASIITTLKANKSENSNTNITNANDLKREIINSDGSKDIWYPNGNLKKISADGMIIRMLYFNKDIKETNINEGTVKYYYAETNTWHTTYLDGLEILEFPNGQTEHRYKNGIVEIHFPNNSIKVTNPADDQKLEEWRFADGTNLVQMRNGDKILMLPNGQKEIHTKQNKRREYPDGTVKLVYPDGSQETRYSNGRVRLKDKDGKLVMDTEDPDNTKY